MTTKKSKDLAQAHIELLNSLKNLCKSTVELYEDSAKELLDHAKDLVDNVSKELKGKK